ncbi:VWA domain-containing protein [Calothrix sp. FACHB-1219]|uniref:vWA domain-containing protein n=1 Tax=unclassified Calothrix TaxID=2619626 RepID=UPI0016882366|nr:MULTISPECIES: vWA domain-containing protein [unclassified Calothrix]MBD2206053.1 VWA domain-containing protein [Calothrix sp. FACHB-168]MBD2220772.1 VWA domain-containing protein [Calothrix sp. FACHB-1219]
MNFKYFKHWRKYISIQSIAVLSLMSIPDLSIASSNPQGGIDWIVVIDTSASMRGVGGTKNIFSQVKNSITEFVNTARLGDTVTIYSFDKDVTLNANDIAINSNPDRGKLKQIINSLQANGVRTHTGKAVQQALQHSAILNQRDNSLGRTVSIVFLTDGLEDIRGIDNPVSIPSSTQLLTQQQCKPYVFFVSLGLEEHEKQLNEFANNPALCSKGLVLRDPGGVQLNRLAQNIRPVLVKPKLDVNLPRTNLQPVLPGTTKKIKINSISNVNSTVNVQLEDPHQSGISLTSGDRSIDLAANQAKSIPLSLQIPAQVQGGVHNLRLVLTTANNAIAPMTVDLPVTVKPTLEFSPTKLDFGTTEVGQSTATQTLVVKSNIATTAQLQLQGNFKDISVIESPKPISLQVGETKIPLQFQVSDRGSEGKRNFTLVLQPDNSLASPINPEVNLNILIPLGRKIITWTLLVLLLLLITLIAICLIQRKTPWELVEDLRTRNRLEGALLVLKPLPKSLDDEEISLTRLHQSKVCLSNLIPAIADTDADAELVVAWRAGKKNISIQCLKGVIFVNTKKINTEELYDEDIIEIGDVKLQFNWIAHQRPFEPNSEQTNF